MKKTKKNSRVKEPVVAKSQPGFVEFILNHPYLFIVLLPIVCFGRTLFFGYVDSDDQLFIVDHEKMLRDFSNVPNLFSHGIWSFVHFIASYDYYRPFLMLSLMIDAHIGGTSPVIYHFSNLLYHLVVCLLLYKLFIKLKIKKGTSLFFTLLFAIHPIVTQAIAWIPGRNDTLLAIFMLASFLNFIRYLETKKIWFLVFHFIFFFFGLLTKESAVFLPLICLSYSTLVLKGKLYTRQTMAHSLAWLIIAGIFFYLRAKAIGKTENEMSVELLAQTVVYRLPAIIQYIGKMIFPFNLSVEPIQQDTSNLPGILSIVLIGVSIYLSKEKDLKKIFFGITWFILFLAPVLFLPRIINNNIFEHRAYLPLMGMLIVLNESFLFKNNLITGSKGRIASFAIVGVFFIISFNQSSYFKNAFVFWQNAALNSPSDADAQIHLSKQYFIQGDKESAEVYIKKALSLNPDTKRGNAGLGAIYAERGEFQKAEGYYKAELKLDSSYLEDFKGLGSVLMNLKKDSEAIFYFEKVLILDSTDNAANLNLALLYFNHQNYDSAKKLWERMLILYPAQLHVNESLAILYSRTGDFEKAILYAEKEEKLGGKMPDGFTEDMTQQLKAANKKF